MSRPTFFGEPQRQHIDRNLKAKLLHYARLAVHRAAIPASAEPLTGNHILVLEALLWRFHNNETRACFPAHATIAKWVGCGISCVQEALGRLEALGLLSWVHLARKTVCMAPKGAWGHEARTRIYRISNSYRFALPSTLWRRPDQPNPCTGGKHRGQRNAYLPSSPMTGQQKENDFLTITNALTKLGEAIHLKKILHSG